MGAAAIGGGAPTGAAGGGAATGGAGAATGCSRITLGAGVLTTMFSWHPAPSSVQQVLQPARNRVNRPNTQVGRIGNPQRALPAVGARAHWGAPAQDSDRPSGAV